MIVQDVYLEPYRWYVRVYYVVQELDVDDVLISLAEVLCPVDTILAVEKELQNMRQNTGFIYSNTESRQSVVVIGNTSSNTEFQNTFDHEKGHLAMHMAEALDIDLYGEDFQYLTGYIGQKLYPVAKLFLCNSI